MSRTAPAKVSSARAPTSSAPPAGDLRTQISSLRGQMEAVKAHWQGHGARSFDQVSEAWKVQTQDIVDVLDTFEANLSGAQRQYDADDAAASSNLAKYNSMLGK